MISAVFLMILVQLSITFSCQDCCTRYIMISIAKSSARMCNCNVTFNELLSYYNMNEMIDSNCSKKELLFQSGTHLVNGTLNRIRYQSKSLSFRKTEVIIIRGEPQVTIKCMSNFYFGFYHISSVTIQNVHLCNCQAGNKFETYGVYFHFWPTTVGRVEIFDSKFTNSMIRFGGMSKLKTVIVIKDTVFENCSKSRDSILKLVHIDETIGFPTKSVSNYITLENLNVRNNNSSFLSLVPEEGVPSYYQYNYCCLLFIEFKGHNYFTLNRGSIFNIIVDAFSNCTFYFSRTAVYIINNAVKYDSFYGISHSLIDISFCEMLFKHAHIEISSNQGSTSGGLAAYNSKIILADNTTIQFTNNKGQDGGAMYLASSTLVLNVTTPSVSMFSIMKFTDNIAQRGGAIYVEDRPTLHGKIIQSDVKSIFDLHCDPALVKIIFHNNSALLSGDQIYGGWIDWFKDEKGMISYNVDITEKILVFDSSSSDTAISSHPIRICLCNDGHPDCTITNHTMEIYGYAANVELVAVGQRYTPVLAFVKARESWESEACNCHESQLWPRIVSFQDACMNITYKIYSSEETLILKPFDFSSMEEFKIGQIQYFHDNTATTQALVIFEQLFIQLTTQPCPLGFVLHKSVRNCICQPKILSLGLNCDYDNSKFIRKEQQWVGVTNEHTVAAHEHMEVIVHQRCPFDYCRRDNYSLSFRLENQDELCAHNRSGVLCGSCETNFSRVLSSSKCRICSNNLILLAAIPSWLLIGLMLVILLMLFDLTVSNGTIS